MPDLSPNTARLEQALDQSLTPLQRHVQELEERIVELEKRLNRYEVQTEQILDVVARSIKGGAA